MLDRLIEWSLKNQLVVIVGLVLAVLGGSGPSAIPRSTPSRISRTSR